MTDPLEDRLRSHFDRRAAGVTAEPDPSAFVERSAGRARLGAPVAAGVLAAVALLTGGGFVTGWSLAGSAPASTTGTGGASAPLARGASASTMPGAAVSGAGAGVAPLAPLTSLFTRTTTSGVTVRVYTSTPTSAGGCTTSAPCPPIGTVPAPVPCPAGALCAEPVTTPTSTAGAGSTGGSSTGTGTVPTTSPTTTSPSTTSPPTTSPSTTSPTTTSPSTTSPPTTTTTTEPQQAGGCRQLTLEFSTDAAVGTATLVAPSGSGASSGPGTVQPLMTGSFGDAEGAPVGWVALLVSGDVASVRLVSPSGAVLDAMTPSSGVVVLAATGASALAGTSVVGLDASGTTVTTVATDQGASGSVPGCVTTLPGTPTTGTTTGPTTSTVVPPVPLPSVEPATRST